jgi:hypothetical protein
VVVLPLGFNPVACPPFVVRGLQLGMQMFRVMLVRSLGTRCALVFSLCLHP